MCYTNCDEFKRHKHNEIENSEIFNAKEKREYDYSESNDSE